MPQRWYIAVKTGTANLPLHYGIAPRWLFERMTRLAREITLAVVAEYGPEDMLSRMSDPFWFQALGCILGFDWHSSGVTTTVCGALKEGIKGLEPELGLFIAGGKGGIPYPVDRATYDKSIELVGRVLRRSASLSLADRDAALRRLGRVEGWLAQQDSAAARLADGGQDDAV